LCFHSSHNACVQLSGDHCLQSLRHWHEANCLLSNTLLMHNQLLFIFIAPPSYRWMRILEAHTAVFFSSRISHNEKKPVIFSNKCLNYVTSITLSCFYLKGILAIWRVCKIGLSPSHTGSHYTHHHLNYY